MSGKIIVTGATGNIGTPLVKALVEMKANFRAVTHSEEKAQALRGRGVDAAPADMSSGQGLDKAFEGGRVLFLLTPPPQMMGEAAHGLVSTAKKAGIKHIVKLSGMGADQGSISLAKWHRAVEVAIEQSGLAWTHLRPNSFMQNYLAFHAGAIKGQGMFYAPQGDGAVSFVDTRDVAAVSAAVLTNPSAHAGKAYTITGPEALTNQRVAAILSEATGKAVTYVDVPEDTARDSMLKMGMPDWLAAALLELFAINKAGYTAAVTGDIQAITGRAPRTFADFARDNAEAFR
jgi:uncharacterized protein YbjT (DUF2867 family)